MGFVLALWHPAGLIEVFEGRAGVKEVPLKKTKNPLCLDVASLAGKEGFVLFKANLVINI